MAELLRYMVDKSEWLYEYDGGPHGVYIEREINKLRELVILMENID